MLIALAAGIFAFFLVHATFVFAAVAVYDKDLGSARFALLDGLLGFPVSALGAFLATYFSFVNLTFLEAKAR